MDPAAYLRRIRWSGAAVPSVETLQRIHVAHLQAIPFENLDVHLGRPIVLELPALFEKIVERRRGGFCYELNGLFAWLLGELGFEVDLLSARAFGTTGEPGPEFDHLALRVDADGPRLVDVGFGECFQDPLPLAEVESVQRGDAFRLRRREDEWLLDRRRPGAEAEPQYLFSPRSRELADFEGMCRFHQTSPGSHFTRRSLCTRAIERGRVTLSGARFIVTEGGERHEEVVASPETYRAILKDRFGIELSPDADIDNLMRSTAAP